MSFGLPKYFDNLHLVMNSMSGNISIASIKLDEHGRGLSDKQKDVTKEFDNINFLIANDIPDDKNIRIQGIETKDHNLFVIHIKSDKNIGIDKLNKILTKEFHKKRG